MTDFKKVTCTHKISRKNSKEEGRVVFYLLALFFIGFLFFQMFSQAITNTHAEYAVAGVTR